MHMAQLMPLPLTVSCSIKIQIGFTFLVPAHPGSPGQRAIKRVMDDDDIYMESVGRTVEGMILQRTISVCYNLILHGPFSESQLWV